MTEFRDILKEHKCKTKHIDLYIINCKDFSHPNESYDGKFLNEIVEKIKEKRVPGIEPGPDSRKEPMQHYT